EVAEFFAAGVDDEDLARIAEIGNVAVAEFLGVADEAVAIAGRGEAEDLFAVGRYFDDALVGDDPGVAVGEALAAHEAVLDFGLPEDLAFEVALGDAAAGLLGDEDAVAADQVAVHGMLHVVEGPADAALLIEFEDASVGAILAVPGDAEGEAELAVLEVELGEVELDAVVFEPVVPGGPDLAADAGDAFAQTHGGRFFAGDASEHFLRLPGDVHRAFVEEGDQGGRSAVVACEEEALGGAPADAWIGILEGGIGVLALGEGGAGDDRRRRRARHRVLLRQRLDDDVVRGAAALRVAQTDR